MFYLDDSYLERAAQIGLTSKYAGLYFTNLFSTGCRERQSAQTLEVLTSIKLLESDNRLEDYIDVQRYKKYVNLLIKRYSIKSFILNIYPLLWLLIMVGLLMFKAPAWITLTILLVGVLPFYYTKRYFYMPHDEVVVQSIEVAQNIIDDLYEQHKHGINHHYRSKNKNILNVDTTIDNTIDQVHYQAKKRFTRLTLIKRIV